MELTDPQAFTEAYRRHRARVYSAAYSVTGDPVRADDVTQDVFMRFWRNPGRYDERRGELGPYLQMMARSRALDMWRSEQAGARALDRLEVAEPAREVAREERPETAAELASQRGILLSALRRLPAAQREAVLLAYWGELTVAEVARRSRVPFGTAKGRIRLGVQKLRAECGPALREAVAEA